MRTMKFFVATITGVTIYTAVLNFFVTIHRYVNKMYRLYKNMFSENNKISKILVVHHYAVDVFMISPVLEMLHVSYIKHAINLT